MRTTAIAAGALLLMAGLSGCSSKGDIMQEMVQATNEAADGIENAKNDQEAQEKFKGYMTKVADIMKRAQDQKLSQEEMKKLAEKHQGELQKAQQRLGQAMLKHPNAMAGAMGGFPGMPNMGGGGMKINIGGGGMQAPPMPNMPNMPKMPANPGAQAPAFPAPGGQGVPNVPNFPKP